VVRIDIGCGHKPKPGFDVYTDVYMSKEVENNPDVKSKFVKAPLEDMSMFKDKQFDYAWCHHVIEHTIDPEKACNELMRIAKEGVLYFPTPQIELICGRYDHRWVVFKIADDHLLFISRYFKPHYHSRVGVPDGKGALLKLEQEPFKWKDRFKVSVIKVGV
jgi:ubiquinone/menaquinone biosynthesis C-methylase UbiE